MNVIEALIGRLSHLIPSLTTISMAETPLSLVTMSRLAAAKNERLVTGMVSVIVIVI
jgi:hypothetical protein